MTHIEIKRLYRTPSSTIGTLSLDGVPFCWTLELPWKMNEKFISCIPTGAYTYEQYMSNSFNRLCLSIKDVYDRSAISIHPGNVASDIQGCICPGLNIGTLNGKLAVLNSKLALDKIIAQGSTVGKLTINERY